MENKKLEFTLPLPPTDNQRLIQARGRFISSGKYRTYKDLVAIQLKDFRAKNILPPFSPSWESPCTVTIKQYLTDKRRDWTNVTKVLFDILTQNGVWTDDKFCLTKYELPELDKDNPRVEITIEQIERPE